MIVFYAKDNLHYIPAWKYTNKPGEPSAIEGEGSCTLLPGYTYQDDAKWAIARQHVPEWLADGTIKEEWTKVDEMEAAAFPVQSLVLESDLKTETKKRLVPAELKDINRPRVHEVVKTTYHTDTLKRFDDAELRQDVKMTIMKQIQGVEDGSIRA